MIWIIAFCVCFSVLAYQRAALNVWLVGLGTFLILMTLISKSSAVTLIFSWIIFLLFFIPLYAHSWRRKIITSRILAFYRRIMPSMSRTEREALAAGTIDWEGDLFRGVPHWEKLLDFPKATLSADEQAFLNGPVEELCSMINDWDITHNRADLPPEIWQFLKTHGFFALIIPKKYGGKEFSAYAHSQILVKVYSVSASVATTIGVPNSLGPAELLLHYGTSEQKDYYLPRLARGEEIPCFALTGPEAGSDAGAMTDTGIVCKGYYNGEEVLGIRLNWNKRYITLAPVATVIGLAFKLYDPEHLLSMQENLGITCALVPRNTPGVIIGRRHFPCNIAFQNGPTQGKDVFLPLECIIGGAEMAGHGWRMLMECLAAGRAISLPASATGGSKVLTYAAGAYARIRRQFNVPISHFEGIEEALARIAALAYVMDATRTFTAARIDAGQKPALASAITKYHVTELGRTILDDGMDIHAGKGICLGPNNYLGRTYQSTPIAITVEGANILTRNMIIFGQGAMRCHPYIFNEFEAANQTDNSKALIDFDKALLGHLGYSISLQVRTFILSLTGGYIAHAPKGKLKRYYQQASRLSAAFAYIADISLLVLGGSLKRKENISARLGDIHSYLYLLSAVLKFYQDQGENEEDLPITRWACLYCLYQIQQAFDALLVNYPNKFLKYLLRFFIFPWGKLFLPPSDKLSHQVAQLLQEPSASRYRLSSGMYSGQLMATVEDALLKTVIAEPVEKIIKSAVREGVIKGDTLIEQANAALAQKIISQEQWTLVNDSNLARAKVIAVDDFAAEELTHMNMNEIYEESHSTNA